MREATVRENRNGFRWPTYVGEPCTCGSGNTKIQATMPGQEMWKCDDCQRTWWQAMPPGSWGRL